MPVWLEPKGSRKVKLAAFVVYLRAMAERYEYQADHTASLDWTTAYICFRTRAVDHRLMARQLEAIIE